MDDLLIATQISGAVTNVYLLRMSENQRSTRQLLAKIPNFPFLYRHTINGNYYGIKKIARKRHEHSLRTIDRKVAERKLKQWVSDLERIDTQAAQLTLCGLLDKFLALGQGQAPKTRATDQAIVNVFQRTWRGGLDIWASEIKPSHLNEWLAQHEARLKNSTYNRYARFLKQLFGIAKTDRLIADSPFEGVRTKWKRPQKPVRNVPTLEQFYRLFEDIRAQQYNGSAEESANFVQFLGEAGVGQAEAASVTKGDIDWERNVLRFRRHKTQTDFYVPIYAHLKPLLKKLESRLGTDAPAQQRLFRMKDAKRALAGACRRLAFKHFTQRNIRQVLIRRLWQSGVDYKLIAKWQGHRDGGKLILDTYTEVFSADDAQYEAAQLAKIK
jgi:integrase